MDPNQGSGRKGRAISEAIGFILILAAVIIALSLYLVYILPAMTRENEINTMNEAKERLTEYKIDIDTLWTSRQCSTAYGPAISIGTGDSGGILSFIPGMFKPPNTNPALALNQRDEYITISSDSYYPATTGGYNETGPLSTSPTNIHVNSVPQHLYITISPDDLTLRKGVYVQGPTWSAWLNLTPSYNNVSRFDMTVDSNGFVTSTSSWYEELLVGTDVTISTFKSQSFLVNDMSVYQKVQISGVYPVDLMNPAYGISTELQSPQTIQTWTSNTTVNASYWVYYGTVPRVSSEISAMGSLEFRSNNYYYTPQTYYYQLGGVFLEQQDGAIVEVPPSLSIAYVNGSPVVKVGKILLLGSVQANATAGTGPITMATAVTDIKDVPLASGMNTRWVNLSIQAANQNTAQMWNRTFREIADRGGLPLNTYSTGSAGNTAFILITGNPQLYDIQLSLTQVNVSGDYLNDNPSGGITRSWRSLQSYRALPAPITWTTPTQLTVPPPAPASPPGYPLWPCDWGFGYRINITINKTGVSGSTPLTNFPVLINLTNSPGLAHAQSNGWDINFTDSTGLNPIPYEREYFTIHGTSADLIAWVKVPSLGTSANTTIYMYYGKSVSSDQQNPAAVWDSNYVAVWHLEEDPSTAGAGGIKDSTSKGHDGTDQGGMTSAQQVPGQIGGSLQFNNNAYYVDFGDVADFDFGTSNFTVSMWVKGQALSQPFATKSNYNGPYTGVYFYKSQSQNQYAYYTGSYVLFGEDGADGLWHNLVAVREGTGANQLKAYLDGSPVATATDARNLANDRSFMIHRWHDRASDNSDAVIDEVRVSSTSRSNDWIRTEYTNQNLPQLFAYPQPEEPGPACPVLVQSKAASSRDATSASVTLDQAIGSGNLVVVSFVLEPQSLAVSSVYDSTGTYTLARGPDPISTWGNLYTYYGIGHAGASTITAQFSGTAYGSDLFAAEFSGVASSNPLDQTSAGSGSTASIDSGSRNTTQDRELIYGFAATDTIASPKSPYILINALNGHFTAYNVVSARGFYNVTGTNTAGNWACQMATFKGA